jgi:SAM-dependent methyltransferase/uncharacterized protein YbaR (Trm112 family)
VEDANKESNKAFYNTRRDDDRRRFEEQPSKRFVGETLRAWILPQLEPGDRILDIAGGSGVYASQIAQEAGVAVVGIDISESMVRQRSEDPSLPLNVVGDMEALPFASGSFDGVLFVAALHHVPDALPALREAWRVLRPGGRLYAREPCSLLRAASTTPGTIKAHPEEFRISIPYLVDRARKAGFVVDEVVPLGLSMRLLQRVVRKPSLAVYRAGHAFDGVAFRVPGIARLAEGCLLGATKPSAPNPPGAADDGNALVDLLACPACAHALVEDGEELSCPGCGAEYTVSDGVRILLPPQPVSIY